MKPRVLIVAPTRDGYANPSRRLADKHTRLFHGRTLDEWYCIRCWASRYCTAFALVGETEEHCERIRPMVESYGGEVICRPEGYLHPLEDTGGQPIRYGYRIMTERHGPYNLVVNNFVVNPVMPPDLLDRGVERFIEVSQDVEVATGMQNLEPMVPNPPEVMKELGADGRAHLAGSMFMNTSKVGGRYKTSIGWNVGRPDFFEWAWMITMAGVTKLVGQATTDMGTIPFEVPWWTDIHIDTEDDWRHAEWQFGTYIGTGLGAFQKYKEYRDNWRIAELCDITGGIVC
jgi:hypothetical protein